MKKQSGPLRKFFSLNRWRRRDGAEEMLASVEEHSVEQMKRTILNAGEPIQTRGSHNDIRTQVEALTREFSEQPELVLYHATLIVLIRRESDVKVNFEKFSQLWQQETDWLLKHLNIRWLVSAADTLADYATHPADRTMALGVSILVNTVKAYESEHYLQGLEEVVYLPDRMVHVQSNLVPMFEGVSCYTVGTDDTLRNMVWRIQAQTDGSIPGRIFLEIFNRLSRLKTAFGRMKAVHTRSKTVWWS